jgi:hypothetical protein
LLLFGTAGAVYVYISGRHEPATAVKTVKSTPLPTSLKPKKPAANAPEGVALQSLTSPVKAGENTSITIKTLPTSTCTVAVTYSNGAVSRDSGLSAKKADDFGIVTWAWTVEPAVPAGTHHVKVTCAYNGRTGVFIGNLEVTKS